jgi:hypothetical protein
MSDGNTTSHMVALPHGLVTMIDEADWPAVEPLTLYRSSNGYVYYSVWQDGRSQPYTLHAFLMDAPAGSHIDHINGDKLDNRRANLRVTTPQINQLNRKALNRNNQSGVRGVGRLGSRWRAQITVNRKNHHLGMFATMEEAIAARRAAELEHYGELCP